MVELLILTGSMGTGKSSVLAEASDILSLNDIHHAAIDVDTLSLGHLPPTTETDSLLYENLRSVCKNYAARGIQRFLLAKALEHKSHLGQFRRIVSATHSVVCRLTASIQEMQRRVKLRETGLLGQKYLNRVAVLNTILERAHLEDFAVVNESRPLTEVALEVLTKAGWISN